MKVTSVKHPAKASWIRELGYRLDAPPFVSGALEARKTLESLSVRKDPLRALTTGHDGGIYNGPHFSRTYVDDTTYGVPFVGSSDMLLADLSNLPLLRRRDATSPKLSYLELKPGMTLISCSGTIGRTVFCRPEMAGMWSSQHIMKVVPDESKIPPGYLYAFISSRFGIPIVISGTYGSIIQSIEPQHLTDLPVPRFGKRLEQKVHDLVHEAAELRSQASAVIAKSVAEFHLQSRIPSPRDWSAFGNPLVSEVSARSLLDRADAFYFATPNLESRAAYDSAEQTKALHEVAEVFIPGIFKRRYADDAAHGVPYLTGADVFTFAPTSDRYLMNNVAERYGLVLKKGMIVIQEAGQLSGLIGRAVFVGDYLDGFACSNNMVRVVSHEDDSAGYLFAALTSEHGVRLLKREGAGTSIPHLECGRVARVKIPWPQKHIRFAISKKVDSAILMRDRANDAETEARRIVEEAIEGNG